MQGVLQNFISHFEFCIFSSSEAPRLNVTNLLPIKTTQTDVLTASELLIREAIVIELR